MASNDPSVLIAQLKELQRWAIEDFHKLAAVRTQNWIRGNFKRQSYGESGAKWKGRANGNNSLALLVSEQSPKKKSGSKPLIRDSIFTKAVGQQIIVTAVENGRKYLKIHNEGGTITQTVTDRQRAFFWAKHYEAKAASQAVLAERWKRMALSKTLTIVMPQRQFMPKPNENAPDELVQIWVRDIEKKVDAIFK